MKVPSFIITLVCGAFFALQGWTLSEVTTLKAEVAAIKVQFASKSFVQTP